MRLGHATWLLALGSLAASPAFASDKQDFESCDGRVHPGKQDDGMRGEASQSGYYFAQSSPAPNFVIAACTRALASPRLLPTQTLRRVHLIRARAAAQLRLGDTAAALADLDLATSTAGGLASNLFYRRSMGVSLDLLRALALAQSGDMPGAVQLAQAASAARPYSLAVQRVAATILQASRPLGTPSPSPWLDSMRLTPEAAVIALTKEAEIGNFAGVVAQRPAITLDWPSAPMTTKDFTMRDADSQILRSVSVTLDTAYARAATGDPAGARRELDELRAHMDAARPAPTPAGTGMVLTLGGVTWDVLDRYVSGRTRQVEARIAVAEKRVPDAISALVGAPLPSNAATIELLAALKIESKDGTLVPDSTNFRDGLKAERKKALTGVISEAMLAPETPRAVIDYERARPNILGALVGGALTMGTSLLGGIKRTDGFGAKNNPDGTITVEFLGNTPSSALVQEMTLLRAAEVAREAGKPAFVIVKRNDYTRRVTTTRGGVPISSVSQGFKTELTIRTVAAGAEPGRALDAVAIIDALGPLYYEDKPQTAARAR